MLTLGQQVQVEIAKKRSAQADTSALAGCGKKTTGRSLTVAAL
jgi:hypothetical protein